MVQRKFEFVFNGSIEKFDKIIDKYIKGLFKRHKGNISVKKTNNSYIIIHPVTSRTYNTTTYITFENKEGKLNCTMYADHDNEVRKDDLKMCNAIDLALLACLKGFEKDNKELVITKNDVYNELNQHVDDVMFMLRVFGWVIMSLFISIVGFVCYSVINWVF